MKQIIISEIPCSNWVLHPTFSLKIDKSGKTVAEYLRDNNIVWQIGHRSADIYIFKETADKISLRHILSKVPDKISRLRHPYISLNGESREIAPLSYALANPKNTLAVAPGNEYERLFYAGEWADPMLDDWDKRWDKFCFIGRPTEDRIEIAKNIKALGIEIDIYSKNSWPLPNWKGFADNEILVARKYKYKIVCENSCKYKYHSEKLFTSIRSGCVTFYKGDDTQNLSYLGNSFLRLNHTNLVNYKELDSGVVKGMEKFMFTDAWEIYSLREFYNRIINLANRLLGA